MILNTGISNMFLRNVAASFTTTRRWSFVFDPGTYAGHHWMVGTVWSICQQVASVLPVKVR